MSTRRLIEVLRDYYEKERASPHGARPFQGHRIQTEAHLRALPLRAGQGGLQNGGLPKPTGCV